MELLGIIAIIFIALVLLTATYLGLTHKLTLCSYCTQPIIVKKGTVLCLCDYCTDTENILQRNRDVTKLITHEHYNHR